MTGGAVAAVDLGATSGRVMIGRVGPDSLSLEQASRFPNGPIALADGLHWNFTGLYARVLAGLKDALHTAPEISSVGIDSWAVDYLLLRGDRILGEPFHYRDERTGAGVQSVHERHPFPELYRRNGLQFLPFNSLYQLATEGDLLHYAGSVLMVPDALGFLLTGVRAAERTNASTTGLMRVSDGEWDTELMEDLGFSASLFPALQDPGTRVGTIRESITSEWGVSSSLDVISVGSHDTASAVLAVPMTDPEHSAYISCGTWGLVGMELASPVVSDAAREANFTNEGGVDGRVRFLHNVMGLWLLSESVRNWEREGVTIDLPELLSAAAAVAPDRFDVFDANDPRFLTPGDLPARIAQWYAEHNLPAPGSQAEYARVIIESLAEAFSGAVQDAARLASKSLRVIHMVGGGSQNELLCQRIADRSGMPVLAGPVEATAIGNVLVQARAAGWLGNDASLETMRALVAATHPPRQYDPRSSHASRS